MIRHLNLNSRPHLTAILIASVLFLTLTTFGNSSIAASDKDRFNALYVPPHKITQRTFDEIAHYATLTPVNAVVMHVKSPKGKLLWPSENAIALQMGVAARHSGLERHVSRLKKRQYSFHCQTGCFCRSSTGGDDAGVKCHG
jgi:hypothetical protein